MENTIKLAGNAVFTSEEDGLYKSILMVKRGSGVIDYLPITAKRRVSGNVYVAGSIRTYCIDNHLHVFVKPRFVDQIDDEDYSQNEAEIVGTICKKSEVRKTPSSKLILDFILAVNNDGYSYYIPCIAWNTTAKRIDEFEIGDYVRVYGRLQSRTYTKDSEDHTVYEVSCTGIEKQE